MATKRAPSISKNGTLSRTLLNYCKGVGGGSLILAVAALFQGPEYFWWFVGFIYIALVVFGLDVFFEPWPLRWIRWVGVSIIGIVTAAFSLLFVFSSAPLSVSAISVPAEYPSGTIIAGIEWRPEFTELDITISGTTRDYSDLNLVIQPDFPVAAVAQLSSVPNVSFEDKNGMTTRQMLIEGTTGNQKANPLVLLATDEGYRLRCERLPASSQLKIVMAIVDIKWNPLPPQSRTGFEIFDRNYMLRLKMDDGGTYWYGHVGGDVYTPRSSPQHIKVYGSYVAGQRQMEFANQVEPLVMTRP